MIAGFALLYTMLTAFLIIKTAFDTTSAFYAEGDHDRTIAGVILVTLVSLGACSTLFLIFEHI